jgi:anti-anti-sigma regulatory factor
MCATSAKSGMRLIVSSATGCEATRQVFELALEAVRDRRPVLVDLSAVETVDGGMIAVLACLARQLRPPARLVVVARPRLIEAFAEWRLDATWRSYSDRDSALAGLALADASRGV